MQKQPEPRNTIYIKKENHYLMHSLLSTAQAKLKAWDQARYTPVFMGALSSLAVTYIHSFVLVMSTHMH